MPTAYGADAEFMHKTSIITQPVSGADLITNELIEDINRFDPARIEADARAYKAR